MPYQESRVRKLVPTSGILPSFFSLGELGVATARILLGKLRATSYFKASSRAGFKVYRPAFHLPLLQLFSPFFYCICLLLICNSSVYAQTKVPLLFGENKNEKGEIIPIGEPFTKIFSFIEKDINIRFELQIYPWNRAVKLATGGQALIFGLSQTPDRDAIFSFSEPAMYRYLWLVTRSDSRFEFSKLSDLKGKTIGIVRGSKYGGEFDAQKGKLFATDDDIDAYAPRLKKLLNKRIDAMIFASSSMDAKEVEKVVNAIKLYNDSPSPASSEQEFSVLPVPILKDGIRFALVKGKNDLLIKKISKSLQKFHAREALVHPKKMSGSPKR